jgi:hypothetical protein
MERLVVVNGRSRHVRDGLVESRSPYLTWEISRVRWRYPFVLHSICVDGIFSHGAFVGSIAFKT